MFLETWKYLIWVKILNLSLIKFQKVENIFLLNYFDIF